MKRVTQARLEEIAFENPGKKIEIDAEQGIALLRVGRTTYYANTEVVQLPDEVAS